jgi:SAM-dependent methyltransferase
MTQNLWDGRYSKPGFVYGTEANVFLTEQAFRLAPGMKTLSVGDGEGRNSVWLAAKGLDVLAVDISPVGLDKGQALAAENGVAFRCECADLTLWDWPRGAFDLVVVVFLHFDSQTRPRMHRAMLDSLKPGGLLIMEAFTVDQLEYGSGGPPVRDMLYGAEILRSDFAGAEFLELTETVAELHEGPFHDGAGAVVRAVLRKPE